MKKFKNITTVLATAATSLAANSLAQEVEIGKWDFNTAILYYKESDRVQAIEPVFSARRQIATDESLTLKLTIDSLTGASASGAVPSAVAQTYTRPSGAGRYTTPAGETPLDDTFLDTRYQVSASWEKPLTKNTTAVWGANFSEEYDYLSIGFSAQFSTDTNKNNRSYLYGVAAAFDKIDPEGGVPTAFGQMQPAGVAQPRGADSETKNVVDALFGITQVIDRYSLMQLNYSVSYASGYLSDPFKVISVLDTNGRPEVLDAAANLPHVVFENRPDTRLKHSFYGQYKRQVRCGDIIDTSYRLMIDDWGITSHTLDFRYRFKLNDASYLRPHLRFYTQSEVDFNQPYFRSTGRPSPGDTSRAATSDYRVGEFDAITVGLEYGRTASHWAVALEYYLQSGSEPGKFGELNQLELFPDVDALMLRVNYDF